MSVFDVVIEYTDGRIETVREANRTRVRDGQLEVWYDGRGAWGTYERHLGGFPLVNIRKWNQVEKEGVR